MDRISHTLVYTFIHFLYTPIIFYKILYNFTHSIVSILDFKLANSWASTLHYHTTILHFSANVHTLWYFSIHFTSIHFRTLQYHTFPWNFHTFPILSHTLSILLWNTFVLNDKNTSDLKDISQIRK